MKKLSCTSALSVHKPGRVRLCTPGTHVEKDEERKLRRSTHVKLRLGLLEKHAQAAAAARTQKNFGDEIMNQAYGRHPVRRFLLRGNQQRDHLAMDAMLRTLACQR